MSKANTMTIYKKLFAAFMKEEWRLHEELFGGKRFLLFPVFIGLLVYGLGVGISQVLSGILNVDQLLLGIYGLFLIFGLQTGTIVFINRDQLDNLLGKYTPLLYTAKIVSQSDTDYISIFMLKDILYYSILIIAPVAVGFAPIFGAVESIYLFLSFVGMFSLGIGFTVTGISIRYRFGKLYAGKYILFFLAFFAGSHLATDSIFGFTPAGSFYGTYGSFGAIIGWLITGLLLTVASLIFVRGGSEQGGNQYDQSIDADSHGSALQQKLKLDVLRSSGGYGTVLFSGVLVILVALGLISLLQDISSYMNPAMIAVVVTSMGASFTTYTWINQADGFKEYLTMMYSAGDVLDSKMELYTRYFLVVVLGGSLISALSFNAITVKNLGIIIVLGIVLGKYYYGVLSFLAGFNPNEALFDVVRFGLITLLIGIGTLPVLIYGIFADPKLWSSVVQILFGVNITTIHITILSAIYIAILVVMGIFFREAAKSYWDVNSRE